jgi:hypothetical protein
MIARERGCNMAEEAQVVATLVVPQDYVRHLNQVVAVTTDELVFLKRKFISRSGHELVRHPLGSCASVAYHDERPLMTLISGVLLLALIASLVALLVLQWNQLAPGTRVYPGLLLLAAAYGVRRAFGARRHRLVFTMRDGTKLSWASRPGDFEVYKTPAERVVELARSRELMARSPLVRTP